MPQFSYDRKLALNGQECDGYGPRLVKSFTNALLAQESDIVLGAFSNGTYTVRLSNADGRVIDISTGAITPANIAAIVAALEAAADALVTDLEDSLENVAVVTDASPNLEIRFIHPGEDWTISFPSNPDGDMSHTLVQAAGGTNIALGVFVVRGAEDDECKAPVNGSVDADFVGMTTRNTEALVMDYTTGDPVFEPADTVSVKSVGANWTDKVEDAVSAGAPVYVRRIATAANPVLGAPRSDADGGNAVLLTGAVFETSSSAGGELVKIRMNRP